MAERREPVGSPFRLNLEQQRKRAKELLHALRAGDEDAWLRFRMHHPRARHLGEAATPLVRLSEAQLVIARELSLPSWARLKVHVAALLQARQSIESGGPALDRDLKTLHIRCGSDLREPLKHAGFSGDFLEYSDALCQGPVVDDPAWLSRRAEFLARAYGGSTGQSEEDIAEKLRVAEAALQSASSRYQRVVIWAEHDSYDQLVLARCLARFAETAPACLALISVDRYPGGVRFVGLGQLPPEALRLLWNERQTVSARQLAMGRAVWDRLRSADPTDLAMAARSGMDELPHMAKAVRRHCQELPWLEDGLSLTERLVLRLLSEGPKTVSEIFTGLMLRREPLPFLGDIMLLFILQSMKATTEPVLTGVFENEQRRWPDERLSITELGRSVLAGDVDWLSLSPPERWLGGVRIAGSRCWRWDERAGTPVMQISSGKFFPD